PILSVLMIGIDVYQNTSIPTLKGAVADARDMEAFLATLYDLRPLRLYNEKATRQAIIDAFHALRADVRIHELDPILIYYAGHGNEVPQPDGWHAIGRMIQTIVPYDTITMDGGEIHNMISDRGLNDMLKSLAESKGDNITVIFDSCYSNSGTRSLESGFVSRCARLSGTVPQDQDKDILNYSTSNSTSPVHMPRPSLDSTYPTLGTHILLAACGSAEVARERFGRGCFTKALTDTLKDVDLRNITYTELSKLLPRLQNQNPHFQGTHLERFLFRVDKLDKSIIPVIRGENNELKLMAGTAQGFTAQSVFELSTVDNEIIGTFKPIKIKQADAILRLHSDSTDTSNTRAAVFPKRARARLQVALAKLPDEHVFKVHFSRLFTDEFVRSVEAETNHRIKNETATAADIIVDIEGGKVVFTMTLRRPKHKEQLDRTTQVDTMEISSVLLDAADIHWRLCRGGREETGISIEFFRVEQRMGGADRDFMPIWRPVEPVQNLIRDGVIDVSVDSAQNKYGMKLKNNTNFDFYPYICCCNLRSLEFGEYYNSISEHFLPLSSDDVPNICAMGGDKVDAPLPRGSELAIGYGTNGGEPFSCDTSTSLSTQYEFFKIFLTTSPLSVSPSMISPFTTFTSTRGMNRPVDYWYTCLIKLIERFP
ncbi:caspase domain-containing protein, partial [Hysterangium stoloniferum]